MRGATEGEISAVALAACMQLTEPVYLTKRERHSSSHVLSGVVFCIDLSSVYSHASFGFLPYVLFQAEACAPLPLQPFLFRLQQMLSAQSSGVG